LATDYLAIIINWMSYWEIASEQVSASGNSQFCGRGAEWHMDRRV
jgi:hypothetical protein